ncbi:hypothetical protein [Janthinobacterium agaricidamnosum]|uniref:Uncharacterized protein n=1 Tax=Janthinobacterium agaricidamnosum NBRC 102515 = DSM 9628 TaxID=1349767 RepID=W0V793_9BURK|nr:hypothetical protein [Janthinobacterium agaricidamnosum]CDG83228.1 hypothetical protein GJA_2597 [Janthinobacterium agaricidamnosum NBRC 102515 = DSM 9628]
MAAVGVAAPLSAAFYLSSLRAGHAEEKRLALYAEQALGRARQSFQIAGDALR